MKILLSANTVWFLLNFKKDLLTRLARKKIDLVVTAPFEDRVSELESLGVRYIPSPPMGSERSLWSQLSIFIHYLKLMILESPDLCLFSTIKPNIWGGMACLVTRKPYIVNVSGLGSAFLSKSLSSLIARKLYKFVSSKSKVCVCENEDDALIMRSRRNRTVVSYGSGVDLVHFNYSSMLEGPIVFIMISRIIKDKGVLEYLEASKIVNSINKECEFLLVGSSEARNESSLSRELFLSALAGTQVKYLDHIEDIRPLIAVSKILVLPSYREGMPKSVQEAAAMGRASIVTNVSGCKHAVIDGKTGWLCEPRSAESLAKVMLMVAGLDHGSLVKHGSLARAMAEECFSEKEVSDIYLREVFSLYN